MIFDTHSHYDDEQFNTDREDIINQLNEKEIKAVNVGASFAGCIESYNLAKKYPHIYAAVGIHPDEIADLTDENYTKIKEMAMSEKVVAIGEIGLDYHWMVCEEEVQKNGFIRQIELAKEISKPINVHSREAANDTLSIIKEYGKDATGIIHCFSYSKEIAKEYLNMGYYIGIGGVVTFKNSKKLKEVVEYVPLDRIVLETDCPYMSPEPYRGKRNSSLYLTYVATAIGQIKGVSKEAVEDITFKNALDVYKI